MNIETARLRRWTVAALLGCCAASAAAAPKADYHVALTPENSVIGNFPAQKKPILTVKSGAVVQIDGGGGNRWGEGDAFAWTKENGITLTPAQTQAVREIDRVVKETQRYAGIQNGHLLVGPIAVEGAMPGDTLEVRILSVEPRIPYGTVGMRPGRGGIPDDVPKPFMRVVKLDLERRVGLFEPGIEVPLAPFMGVMGVLPADSEGSNRRSGPPGRFGGNRTARNWSPARRCSCPSTTPAPCSSPAIRMRRRATARSRSTQSKPPTLRCCSSSCTRA